MKTRLLFNDLGLNLTFSFVTNENYHSSVNYTIHRNRMDVLYAKNPEFDLNLEDMNLLTSDFCSNVGESSNWKNIHIIFSKKRNCLLFYFPNGIGKASNYFFLNVE